MTIARNVFVKWTLITIFCGGHSFFWGFITKASPFAMVAGMLTIVLMFSIIESHPRYIAKRAASPILSRALHWGLRIRLFLAGWVILVYPLQMLVSEKVAAMNILMTPYMAEIFAGLAGLAVTTQLTGIDIAKLGNNARVPGVNIDSATAMQTIDFHLASYITTMATALIHTAALLLICGIVYAILKVRARFFTKKPA